MKLFKELLGTSLGKYDEKVGKEVARETWRRIFVSDALINTLNVSVIFSSNSFK